MTNDNSKRKVDPRILFVGPIDAENVSIKTTESNRKTNPQIESLLKQTWNDLVVSAKKDGKLLYDGESYRLNGIGIIDSKLLLTVSKIKFSIRKPLNLILNELEKYGEEYYGMGLGIGGLISTTDNLFVFGVRSGKTMTNTTIDFIGGILEDCEMKDGYSLINKDNEEIVEELGILDSDIGISELLGIVLSNTTNVIVITHTNLKLSRAELEEKFSSSSDGEMTDLVFVEKNDLKDYLLKLGGYKPAVVELLEKLNML